MAPHADEGTPPVKSKGQPGNRLAGRHCAIMALLCILVVSCGNATPQPPARQADRGFQPGSQTVVQFPGLNQPVSVDADGAGSVYVLDNPGCCELKVRVLKFAKGSADPVELPFGDLSYEARKLSVDPSGNVFVLDARRVLLLKHGASDVIEVNPQWGLSPQANGIAGCCDGQVYVLTPGGVSLVDSDANRHRLPFTGLNGPDVSSAGPNGDLYVVDTNPEPHDASALADYRVVRMGKDAPAIAVAARYGRTGKFLPTAVAATDNAVYVADSIQHQVWEFKAGRDMPVPVPFTGLQTPAALAVDADGDLVVFDSTTKQILKLTK